ncbi:hypothetical protein SAMN05421810_106166 [Amycolatopsis arida]|uniref:Uncharacterized protein n=1 Tax=Amycolatopsis arida TaxID=587909 RepID=A0A1I5XN28_9PSEU|nr:hypothetical protein [Amycolatopsis arida]TDX97352.1 hypothetical protein CLV69_102455 [Amycolatopsis arida]SFQ33320.1 hypothetical protein SAMN05421810_106166 [Amycolatopsis arida]
MTESAQGMDPEGTLAEVRRVRERARRLAHGGAWLTALLLAALVLGSTAWYEAPFGEPDQDGWITHPFWAGLPNVTRSEVGPYLYWFLGIPLVVAATGAWYRWRGGRVGMRVAWHWYVAITLGALASLAVVAAVPRTPDGDHPPGWAGLLTPLIVVAVAAVALGAVERSPGLMAGGVWLGLITAWHSTAGMGGLSGGATWLLNGGDGGSADGGQLTLLGLHRPGPVLLLMVLPLVLVAGRQLWRTRGGTA